MSNQPRRSADGFSLPELVVVAALSSLVVAILILLYSQTQRVWILGQTQIDVDSDARRVLTQIERRVVMAQSVATYSNYPSDGFVVPPSGYYVATFGYVVPNGTPTPTPGVGAYTRQPGCYQGLPYPSPTPSCSPAASAAANLASVPSTLIDSDVLYMAVPHTSTNPTCSNSSYPDLYFIYADPTTHTDLKQTVYMCYAKSVSPLPVTDSTLATNLGAQVLSSADYESTSPRTSVLTSRLDPTHGFTVTYPTSTTIDITLKVKNTVTVFGKTVSNTYTTRIYTRNR